jgi:hypothetical protein
VLSPTGNLTGSARGLSTARPGAFTILGPPNAAVVISFSTDGKVIGPGPAMLLGAFTHNAGPSPSLGSAGSLTLAVGATVTVGAGPPKAGLPHGSSSRRGRIFKIAVSWMNLAERYGEQAAWARARAAEAATQELRDQWLNLAREYDRLAADQGENKRA